MERYIAGMLVISLRGRDQGSVYAIKEIEGDFLYLVNGEEKTISNPKKKKKKHVQLTNTAISLNNCNDVQLKRKIKEALK